MPLSADLPQPHFDELHQRVVHARPEAVARAIASVTPGEMPFLARVTGARRLPAELTGQDLPDLDTARPLVEQLPEIGFIPLDEEPGEAAWGIIGKLWQIRPEFRRDVSDARGFRSFDESGWAKAGWNLAWAPARDGDGTELRTETRVVIPDRITRLRFRGYWLAAKPAGAKIRRELLQAIAARSEA